MLLFRPLLGLLLSMNHACTGLHLAVLPSGSEASALMLASSPAFLPALWHIRHTRVAFGIEATSPTPFVPSSQG
jgi:hypothetical protein